MKTYSVKQLSTLAGVTVRTLHLYDKLGLLKPSVRTQARYRLYGEQELLRLQQILFYKELDFSLQEIKTILDDPDFELISALEKHKVSLKQRQERFSFMLETIDKTISKLKGKTMLSDEDLYKGLPKETAEAYRNEAIEKYGEETVLRSEKALKSLTKEALQKLTSESEAVRKQLCALKQEDPSGTKVQELIALHYQNIRQFWGTAGLQDKQAEAYKGLGKLYVQDERFMMTDGKPDPEFAEFMSKAMAYFADTQLK